MATSSASRSVRLAGNRSTTLEQAAGTLVVCRAGCVWLTQYGDYRDFILHAGDSFSIDGPGCVVMTAHHGAHLEFLPPLGGARHPAGPQGLLQRLFAPRAQNAARRLAGGAASEC